MRENDSLAFSVFHAINGATLQIQKILSDSLYFCRMQPISILTMQTANSNPNLSNYMSQADNQARVDPYLLSIMNYQNFLNFELLKNQNLIASYLNTPGAGDKTKIGSQTGSSTSEGIENSNSSLPLILNLQQLNNQPREVVGQAVLKKDALSHQIFKPIKKHKKNSEDSDYEPQKSDHENLKSGKSSESKNVPKNFSKAILLFMKKKQNMVKTLVEQEGFEFEEFMKQTMVLKGKINSISELRSLWIQSDNKYAKIFRIISNLYLRRYSLEHIFNSRVEDFSKHLKYRNKMAQVLKKPHQFTRMKDY